MAYLYPWGNTQELNLDWMLQKIKDLENGGGSGADIEEIANVLVAPTYRSANTYQRYDYAFYNGKLYRAIANTTGVFNPSDWLEVQIGNDVAILTRLVNAIDAAAVIDVKFDTTGTNGKLQQKYNNAYHDVVEVDYTPVQNSKRPLSSNAGYELNGAINALETAVTPTTLTPTDTGATTIDVSTYFKIGKLIYINISFHINSDLASNTNILTGLPTTDEVVYSTGWNNTQRSINSLYVTKGGVLRNSGVYPASGGGNWDATIIYITNQ